MIINDQDNYTIKIKQFEGPFDLLLFFIERDEVDIMDIPISKITKDFLAYIRELEIMNIDVASEFILVAATLMRIKAKMLLPRPELNELGEEVDPREELTRKLIEYKKFKDILADLSKLEQDRLKLCPRGNTKRELKEIASKALVDVELESLTLFKLFKSFEQVMNQLTIRNKRPVHLVYKYKYTLEEQKEFILSKIHLKGKINFQDVFLGLRDRLHCIITFLSLLELINSHEIQISNGMSINNFFIELAETA
jgi:segregation and condensation protein A